MMCVFIGVLKRYLNQTVVKFELGAVSSSLLCVRCRVVEFIVCWVPCRQVYCVLGAVSSSLLCAGCRVVEFLVFWRGVVYGELLKLTVKQILNFVADLISSTKNFVP
jgi:hypothetical protein